MTVHFAPADADNYNAARRQDCREGRPEEPGRRDAAHHHRSGPDLHRRGARAALTVVYNGVTLAAGVDYDVAYANNVEVGTAGYTVTFKGNYARHGLWHVRPSRRRLRRPFRAIR